MMLKDKSAIITAPPAASARGSPSASQGARVVIADFQKAAADATAQEIRGGRSRADMARGLRPGYVSCT